MRIRAIICLFLAGLILHSSMASQTPFVKLAFEVDGQQELEQEVRLAIEIDGNTFEPKNVKGGFIVPAEVQNGQQIKLRFTSGKYDLSFRQMTKQHFGLRPFTAAELYFCKNFSSPFSCVYGET